MATETAIESRAATLSTFDTISVIVGIVIGAGIYETPPFVFGSVSSGTLALAAWAVGGLLCLNGAFTYAELASAYPRSGGDYVYLTRAFGSWLGFLFGWAQISVILTGSIGMMAYVFANYAATLWDFGPATTLTYAVGSVLILSLTNLCGVALGKYVQNVLSSAKLLGLAAVIIAGLLAVPPQSEPVSEQAVVSTAPSGAAIASFASALVLVFLTYGGWNDAAFFVAEMRDRKKIIRALSLGILIITVVYLLINAAYLRALGWPGVRDAKAIASDAMLAAVGPIGARGVALLVTISALGAVNGIIFAGSRVYAAVGEDHRMFALLARRDPRFGSPIWSLAAQAAITVAMIIVVGTEAGQQGLNRAFSMLGLDEVSWAGKGGFDTLLRCTAPVFWLFFLLTSLSLFVLRRRDPHIERPFRTPLYPLCPLLFTATCAYMLYGGIRYAESLTWVGLGLLAAGVPVYLASRILTPTDRHLIKS
jgi:basic amino acid/polyamine antiporter, APA family